MPISPEKLSNLNRESREAENKRSNLTVYLMRHGESEPDKSKPSRGLTEKGIQEVTENFNGIINQIIKDELPSFNDFDNPEERKKAALEAFAKVELHLADSKTDRTMEQAWLQKKILTELGIKPEDLYLSKATYEWAQKQGLIEKIPESAGPGIKKRVAGVGGLDRAPDFRRKIDSPEYKQKVGAQDGLIAWALTPDDEVPEGVENRSQMKERLHNDLDKVEHVSQKRLNDYPRRVVYMANSHASIATLAASSELKVPIEKLGEVDNAEGLRFDFYGPGKSHTTQPFGKNLEAKVADLKKE